MPASTYTGTVAEGFRFLDEERLRCGAAVLSQSAALDAAAQKHAEYQLANNVMTHDEDPALGGFTGATLVARLASAGYAWGAAGEVIWPSYGSASAAEAVRNLLGVPYHARILLANFSDVGFGYAASSAGTRVVLDLGTRSFGNEPASVMTYPCEGTTGALASNSGEVPSPLPGGGAWGQPLLVRGAADLQLKSVAITGPAGAVPIQVIYGGGQTPDPNGMVPEGWAVVLPAVLAPQTTYSVALQLVSSGVATTRNFQFRTGGR